MNVECLVTITLLLLLLSNTIRHYDDTSKYDGSRQCFLIDYSESFAAAYPHLLGFQKSLKILIWHCPKFGSIFRYDAKLQRIAFYDPFRSV